MKFMPCLLAVVRYFPSDYHISSSTAVIFFVLLVPFFSTFEEAVGVHF